MDLFLLFDFQLAIANQREPRGLSRVTSQSRSCTSIEEQKPESALYNPCESGAFLFQAFDPLETWEVVVALEVAEVVKVKARNRILRKKICLFLGDLGFGIWRSTFPFQSLNPVETG